MQHKSHDTPIFTLRLTYIPCTNILVSAINFWVSIFSFKKRDMKIEQFLIHIRGLQYFTFDIYTSKTYMFTSLTYIYTFLSYIHTSLSYIHTSSTYISTSLTYIYTSLSYIYTSSAYIYTSLTYIHTLKGL